MLEKGLNSREYSILQSLSKNIQDSEIYWYKNRPYKILTQSKAKIHGEWQDITIYICLYDNEDGSIWVRPSDEYELLFETKRPENPYLGPNVKSITQ